MQITLGTSHVPCTRPLHATSSLHMTSPRDPCTWPLWSLTQFVELTQLITSLWFRQKRNFFGVPKIRIVSTRLLSFTLSIPLDQSYVFITRLTVLQLGANAVMTIGPFSYNSRFLTI